MDKADKPELFRDRYMNTFDDWIYEMEVYGHIRFHVKGVYYFLYPLGKHEYALCLLEDEATGNFPRWTFQSEREFLQAPLFDGECMANLLDEVMFYDE